MNIVPVLARLLCRIPYEIDFRDIGYGFFFHPVTADTAEFLPFPVEYLADESGRVGGRVGFIADGVTHSGFAYEADVQIVVAMVRRYCALICAAVIEYLVVYFICLGQSLYNKRAWRENSEPLSHRYRPPI